MKLTSLTLQQAFDLGLNGIRAQRYQQSVRTWPNANTCAYRGVGGLKCWIGHCIPDSVYDVSLEGTSIDRWVTDQRQAYSGLRSLFVGHFPSALRKLQSLHDQLLQADRPGRIEAFEAGCQAFAREYYLTYTAPKESP